MKMSEMIDVTPGKNYMKITEMYAFVSSDPDGEGVVAQSMNMMGQQMMMPFVAADKARMESIKPLAKHIAKTQGKKIKLIKFTVREDLEEYV